MLHIYPQVKGALLSWKAARGLKKLPESYPHPPPSSTPPSVAIVEHAPVADVSIANTPQPVSDELIREFPSVFDGRWRVSNFASSWLRGRSPSVFIRHVQYHLHIVRSSEMNSISFKAKALLLRSPPLQSGVRRFWLRRKRTVREFGSVWTSHTSTSMLDGNVTSLPHRPRLWPISLLRRQRCLPNWIPSRDIISALWMKPDYFYNTFRQIQIPQSPLRYILFILIGHTP